MSRADLIDNARGLAGLGLDKGYDELLYALSDELERLEEQEAAQSIDRSEWHEGMVSVYDYEGNCVGSMGQETWAWMLNGGKEQLEACQRLLVEHHAEGVLDGVRPGDRCPVCAASDPARES